MNKAVKILFLILILFVSSFAQNKVGVINSDAFYDEKTGIKILTETVKLTYDCDFLSSSFRKKIDELKSKINDLQNQGKSVDENALELSKVKEEFSLYQKNRDESYKKRYSILVTLLETRIKDKLKLFSTRKSYTKIIDLSDDKVTDSVLYFDNSINITKEFIKFCNEEFEKEKHKINE